MADPRNTTVTRRTLKLAWFIVAVLPGLCGYGIFELTWLNNPDFKGTPWVLYVTMMLSYVVIVILLRVAQDFYDHLHDVDRNKA